MATTTVPETDVRDLVTIEIFGEMQRTSSDDLEVYEHQNPVLFLWRRLNLGSGGVGRTRGGNGVRVAWTPWRTPGGQITAVTACNQVPPAGLFGGYPSSAGGFKMTRGAKVDELLRGGTIPSSFDQLDGDLVDMAPKTFAEPLPAGELFEMHAGGGGGVGDPLEREPDVVGRDVYLSAELAAAAHGVKCSKSGEVDAAGTAELAPAGADYRDHVPMRLRNAAEARD